MLKDHLKVLKAMPLEELRSLSGAYRKAMVEEMLQNIGSVDEELRDHCIYAVFSRMILEGVLTDAEMIAILKICSDKDHLFYQIDQPEPDAVFTRSFSSLVIALILQKDKTEKFLPDDVLNRIFERSLDYIEQEQDTRGLVEGKGWAHSIAHGADMLSEAAGHPAFRLDRAQHFLAAIKNCLFKEGQYTNEEDDRLIFVLEALLDKGVHNHHVEEWGAGIFDGLHQVFKKEGFSMKFFRVKRNVLNFMQSLYFRLLFSESNPAARAQIAKKLDYWHKQLYPNKVEEAEGKVHEV